MPKRKDPTPDQLRVIDYIVKNRPILNLGGIASALGVPYQTLTYAVKVRRPLDERATQRFLAIFERVMGP